MFARDSRHWSEGGKVGGYLAVKRGQGGRGGKGQGDSMRKCLP